MFESNYPELNVSSHQEGTWQRCSICNNEFRISDREKETLEFLRKNPYLSYRYGAQNEIEPLDPENDHCMNCIRKICSENVKRDMITHFCESKGGIPDNEEMIRRSLDIRSRAETLEIKGLLSHSKGLRPSSFMGLGERLFEEKLSTIAGSLEFLFQDFPHIEENEFFKREMEELFDTTDGLISLDIEQAELEKSNEFNLKPRIMIEKMLNWDLES